VAVSAPPDQETDGGPERSQLPDLDGGSRRAVAAVLKSATQGKGRTGDRAMSRLVARAQAAVRQVSRVGFRREDRADPAMLAALRASVPAVTDVLAELDRLVAALPQAARREALLADRPRFEAAFRAIYGVAAPDA
jgi:hypothetical protein